MAELLAYQQTMRTFGISEARARLSELIEMVQEGEKVIITRRGIPIAKVIAIREENKVNVKDAIAQMRKFRASHPLRGLTLKKMIEEGRM